ncbi:hypothetical protein Btru_029122 [Bulinus truncatus]|nr:hypothetical protein Btru_029122 [Bulinus truncatus]
MAVRETVNSPSRSSQRLKNKYCVMATLALFMVSLYLIFMHGQLASDKPVAADLISSLFSVNRSQWRDIVQRGQGVQQEQADAKFAIGQSKHSIVHLSPYFKWRKRERVEGTELNILNLTSFRSRLESPEDNDDISV